MLLSNNAILLWTGVRFAASLWRWITAYVCLLAAMSIMTMIRSL